jgi:hypothetical protein
MGADKATFTSATNRCPGYRHVRGFRCSVDILARPLPGTGFMRSFDDTNGNPWQAAVLDASYGNMLLVFSHAGDLTVRKTVMAAENLRLAEQQLLDMDEAQLRDLLAESVPWD